MRPQSGRRAGAVNPILASVGWSLPIIVSGGVIISIVLDIPDIGPVLFTALLSQDSFLAGPSSSC